MTNSNRQRNDYVTHGEFSSFKETVTSNFAAVKTNFDDVKSALRSMEEAMSKRSSTNWGWVVGGLAVIVSISMALGKGFVEPQAKVSEAQGEQIDILREDLKALENRERLEAQEWKEWKGKNDKSVESNERAVNGFYRLAMGDGSVGSGWIDRLARTESSALDVLQEQNRLRERIDSVTGTRFENERGLAVERQTASHEARLQIIQKWLDSWNTRETDMSDN